MVSMRPELTRRACLAAPTLLLGGCGPAPRPREGPKAVDALTEAFQNRSPGGPWPIGLTRSRIDEQEVWIWRPVQEPRAFRALPPSRDYAERLARRFGRDVALALVQAEGHAGDGALSAPDAFPVLLFQPGSSFGARDYRLLIESLASRGTIVLGLHPLGSPRASADRVERAADELRGLINHLPTLGIAGVESPPELVLAGHSIGGAAAVLALDHPSASRAINIDGDYLGASGRPAPDKPILYLLGENASEPASARSRREQVWRRMTDGRRYASALTIPRMDHLDVTDGAVLSGLAADMGRQAGNGATPLTHAVVLEILYDWLAQTSPDEVWRSRASAGGRSATFP